MKRNFISLSDWTTQEIVNNLNLSRELKEKTKLGLCPKLLEQKTYALIFHKHSLRTRVSFEVGIFQLGGNSIHMTEHDFDLGKREAVGDVARVMSRYVDGILIRTYKHEHVTELGRFSEVPVVNMLTDSGHPCQIMADALTLIEHFGSLDKLKIVYLGDGNNITNSWLELAMRLPIHLVVATSPESLPDMNLFQQAQSQGISKIEIIHDAKIAVKDADVLYTDVWASMGQKDLAAQKAELLSPFQINASLLKLAKPSAVVMHCLPAERGREITDEVLDGPQSIVLEQAENRLHAQKAILAQLDGWRRA